MRKVLKNYWWVYILITKPNIYFKDLFISTLLFGDYILIANIIFTHFFSTNTQIQLSIFGYIGFVIGLLLVFRTNTGYDRWWEARKVLGDVYSSLFLLHHRHKHSKVILFKYLESLGQYLRFGDNENHNYVLRFHEELLNSDNENAIGYDLVKSYSSLVRIKETPIPLSYEIHIKTSIFVYLTTLSLVLTTTIGLYSVFVIMILFYIISGVETISKEIENPFEGSPNDHNMEDMFKSWEGEFNV